MLQLYAMINIRLKMTSRELKILFLEIFYPTLLIILSSIILALSTGSYDKLHRLDESLIPNSQTVYYSFNTTNLGQDSGPVENFMSHYYDKGKFSAKAGDLFIDATDFDRGIRQYNDNLYDNRIRDKSYLGVYLKDKYVEDGVTTYDVITFVDPTQTHITGYAIQGTISSILRDHLGEDYSFKFSVGPFSKSKLYDSILKITLTMLTVFSFSIALGVMTASIAGNICKERADSLKHQQIVSGGSMLSYWASNYIVDLAKFAIPGLSFIIIIA